MSTTRDDVSHKDFIREQVKALQVGDEVRLTLRSGNCMRGKVRESNYDSVLNLTLGLSNNENARVHADTISVITTLTA
jgi:small nuclear ribonucleoprotein (snRNP)-like protein